MYTHEYIGAEGQFWFQIECGCMGGVMEKARRQVRWSLAQRGFWGTVRVVVRRIVGGRRKSADALHPFDVEHSVDTSGLIGGGEL